jgi:hypothetical protein
LQEENHRLVKYRRLRKDELEELEGEFIKFLASNTVTADDWVKTKAETPEKAEDLLDVFSDIVFEKILEKVEYLEHKRPKDFRVCISREKPLLISLKMNLQKK